MVWWSAPEPVLAAAVLEMGTRPGPVKEEVSAFQSRFTVLIRQCIVTAIELRELPAAEDPDALTLELSGIILAANAAFVLRQDPASLNMAKNIVRHRLQAQLPRNSARVTGTAA